MYVNDVMQSKRAKGDLSFAILLHICLSEQRKTTCLTILIYLTSAS